MVSLLLSPPPLLLLLVRAGVATAAVAPVTPPAAAGHRRLRIVFEAPVLVDANRTGPSMMDVVPPEDFHRLGSAVLGHTRIFGPGGTPGAQTFDYSSDGGQHWAGVVARGANLPASGIHRTYSIPNRDGSVRFASSGCCGGRGDDGQSLSATAPRTDNLTANGWSDVGASTFSVDASGGLKASWDATTVHRWSGVPFPGINVTATHSENGIRVYPVVALPGGGYVAGVCIVWNGVAAHETPDGPKPFAPLSIVSFTSTDGYNWIYSNVIANWTSLPDTTFGPNEHDMSVLSDGKSLICAIRMDGDAGCSSGTYRYYYQSYSTDRGLSWSFPRPIHGAGCARPRLRLMEPDGPLLLSGGRLCVENTTGLFMWTNANGLAGLNGDAQGSNGSSAEWVRHSLSYWHNLLWKGEPYYRFDDSVNESNAWDTLGYTSLIQIGPKSGAVLYNKFFSPHLDHGWPPWPNANFMMRFSFVPVS